MKPLLLCVVLLVLPAVSSAQAKGKYDEMLDVTAFGFPIDEHWTVGLFGKGRKPACIDSAGIYATVATTNDIDARAQPFEVGLLLKADSILFTIPGTGQPKTAYLSTFSYMSYTFRLTLEQLVALRGASVISARFLDGIPRGNTSKRTVKEGSWEKYPPTCAGETLPADSARVP